jgi:hypothetical protein
VNELQPTTHHPETPEPRRAVFWFVLIEQYEQIVQKLSETTEPAVVAQAVQDLSQLEKHLVAKQQNESTQPLEAMSFRYLLRDVRQTLSGHIYRQEHQIPGVAMQAEYIRNTIFQGQFDAATELLGILWAQADARELHHELSEEFSIMEEILSDEFNPERSLLYVKISHNVSGLESADFSHLPRFFDRQRELLALLERVEPYAERGGWTFTWMAMRNHLLRAEPAIHERAGDLVIAELEDSFQELTETKGEAQELIEQLDRLRIAIEHAGQNPPQELSEELRQTELELAKVHQRLELLELSLGGENLATLRVLDDNELEQMQREVDVMRGTLYVEMTALRKQLTPKQRSLRYRFQHLFTAEEAISPGVAQHLESIREELHHLDAKAEAIASRQRTQYLLRALDAITSMKILPGEDVA